MTAITHAGIAVEEPRQLIKPPASLAID